MVTDRPTTFLTGSTGFIGQYVLRGLLARGHRVVVMLRSSPAQSRVRLAQIMRPMGLVIDDPLREGNLVIAEGALPHDLPEATWGRTDQILHSAACLQLDNDESGEPFTTNFDGVKALADWASRHDVEYFDFVSTAYVCGRNAKHAHETFERSRPEFGTDYEFSKWLAEEFLVDWSCRTGRSLTILRPGLVIGDSATGYTTQYGGFYQLARMIDLLRRFFLSENEGEPLTLPMRLPGKPTGTQNLVPVDYVARAIVEIVTRDELHGRIYHLTNPSPPTNLQVKQWLEEYYQVQGGRFVNEIDWDRDESLAESMFLKMNDLVIRQMSFVPRFDCANTLQALAGSAITFPHLDRPMVLRMLDFASKQQWGRRAKAAV